jgi:hypothetical protein
MAAFEVAGIEIPFPQRTIWHRTDDGIRKGIPIAVDGGGEAGPAAGTGEEAPGGEGGEEQAPGR